MENQEKKVLTIDVQDIKRRLKSGESRKEIKTSLGLSHAQMKELFGHPALKGVRTSSMGLVIVDSGNAEATPVESSEETSEQAPTL